MGKRGPKKGGFNPGAFQKGHVGNPGGLTKEQARERADLRAALEGCGQEVHDALMRLVRADNAQAILYAHQQIIGKPKERIEGSVEVRRPYQEMPGEDLAIAARAFMLARSGSTSSSGDVAPPVPDDVPAG